MVVQPSLVYMVMYIRDCLLQASEIDEEEGIEGGCTFLLYTLELRPILPAMTTLALLALWLAFPAVTPQHSYDSPLTNGKAPRAPFVIAGRRTLTSSFISLILNSP